MTPLPAIDDANRHFWTGGEHGELRFLRCGACRTWIHPPSPRCPSCFSPELSVEAVSGFGTVYSFTVNRHPWTTDRPPPYAVGIVELPEQLGLRVTGELVEVDVADVKVGMPVEVRFRHREDVWVPVFIPASTPTPEVDAHEVARRRRSRPRRTAGGRLGERQAVITGVGQSEVGRRLGRRPLDLTLEAALAAIEHAGLSVGDIDGLATYPGAAEVTPGLSGVGIFDVQDALRLELDWFSGGSESPGQLGSVVNAIAAVNAGLATHVLCFRTVWEGTAQGSAGRSSVIAQSAAASAAPRVRGASQWLVPSGLPSAAGWLAMNAMRHFHTYGTTREQLGAIAVNQRANAARNPKAIYRDPMSLDDYLAARMISDPLCMYDCDVPCDGSTAIIVSSADEVDGLRRPPVNIEAVGTAIHGRPSWDQWHDMTTMALNDAAAMMWARTDLAPRDVDLAELYDGFSIITLCWLEALGFCGRGEGGPFVEGGTRIALDGDVPLNTHGGQLSAGRLHGYGTLHEACLQLWGQADGRQVNRGSGRAPSVAVAAAGGGPYAASILLSR